MVDDMPSQACPPTVHKGLLMLPDCVPRHVAYNIKVIEPIRADDTADEVTEVGRFRYHGRLQHKQRVVLQSWTRSSPTPVCGASGRRPAAPQGRAGTTSLRVLDWLATNYSKKMGIVCLGSDGLPRDLHNSSRDALSFYSRRCGTSSVAATAYTIRSTAPSWRRRRAS